jgi:hypothetical protein
MLSSLAALAQRTATTPKRRFPRPWSVDELEAAQFLISANICAAMLGERKMTGCPVGT